MKALVYDGSEQLSYREVADAEPDKNECLIRVGAVGICGSDMHAYLGHDERRPAPLILGHEAAGEVLDDPLKGQRVTINPLVTCGKCPACTSGRTNLCPHRQIISMPPREGAFAELVRMPIENLTVIPRHISDIQASLSEPFACGWHGVKLAQKMLYWPLETINACVLGGGAIGTGAALSLSVFGVQNIAIAETNPIRRKLLEKIGNFKTYNPLEEDHPFGDAVHLVIDGFGGSATRKAASTIVCPGGVIVHIGLAEAEGGLDVRRMTLQEITFIGTYTYTKQDFVETAQAIFDGKMGSLDWMDTRPLSEGANAFRDLLNGKIASPKVVLLP